MKKLICALMAALILASTLSSCSGESKNSETQTTASGETAQSDTTAAGQKSDSLPDGLDFGGESIDILCRENEDNTSYRNEIGITTETGDIVDDAICARNRTVEERLNVKIVPTNMNGYWDNKDNFLATVRNNVMAGDDSFDLVVGYQAYITQLAIEGLVCSLSDLPYIDIEMPWWNASLLKSNTVGDRCYFLSGDIGLSYTSSIFVLYYNKSLAGSLGIGNLYDDVRDGKWTRELAMNYSTLAASDLNGDGEMDYDNDRWGYVCNETVSLFTSLGANLIDIGADNMPSWNFSDPHIGDEIVWLNKFFYETDGVAPLNTVSTSHQISLDIFSAGNSLFYCSHIGRVEYLRSVEFDFGIIPLFKWDEAQDGYLTRMNDAVSMFCVPVTAEDKDAVGAVMEALGAEGYYSVLPAYYDMALQGKYTRDEDSNEMLDIIRESVVCTFDMTYGQNLSNMSNLANDLVKSKNSDFASYYAKNESKWQASLDATTAALTQSAN